MILRLGLIKGLRYSTLAADMGTYLARTLFFSSALHLSGPEMKAEIGRWASNWPMCELTEKVKERERVYFNFILSGVESYFFVGRRQVMLLLLSLSLIGLPRVLVLVAGPFVDGEVGSESSPYRSIGVMSSKLAGRPCRVAHRARLGYALCLVPCPRQCLSDQVVFSDPYMVCDMNRWTSPELDEAAAELRTDVALRLTASRLKDKFMTSCEVCVCVFFFSIARANRLTIGNASALARAHACVRV